MWVCPNYKHITGYYLHDWSDLLDEICLHSKYTKAIALTWICTILKTKKPLYDCHKSRWHNKISAKVLQAVSLAEFCRFIEGKEITTALLSGFLNGWHERANVLLTHWNGSSKFANRFPKWLGLNGFNTLNLEMGRACLKHEMTE